MSLKSNTATLKLISVRWLLLFAILLILSIPFKYNYIKINILTPLFESIVGFMAPFFLEDISKYTLSFQSDATGLYLNVLVVWVISGVLACSWLFIEKKIGMVLNNKKLYYTTVIIASYYLSLFLLIYGFNKVFKFQFYDAHPNTLFTPVGQLTKDFLYWTSTGSSRVYNIATGGIEIIVALCLLFKRTRALGSILGFLTMCHIVLINFSFDINVKVQSMFFLFLFIVLLYPNIKTYYHFFIKKNLVKPLSFPSIMTSIKLYVILKTVVVILLFTESLYPYIQATNFNGDTATKPPFYGAYEIDNHKVYKRFFIHSDPYFILQDTSDTFYSFPMKLYPQAITLEFENMKSNMSFRASEGIIELQGDFFGESLDIKAHNIDISIMPLYEDSFMWTIDSYNKE